MNDTRITVELESPELVTYRIYSSSQKGKPYYLTADFKEQTVTCTCPAGHFKHVCKHMKALNLLMGTEALA